MQFRLQRLALAMLDKCNLVGPMETTRKGYAILGQKKRGNEEIKKGTEKKKGKEKETE